MKKFSDEEIVNLYKSDKSVSDICKIFNIKTPKIVRNILKDKGIYNPYFLSRYSYSFAKKVLDEKYFKKEYLSCDSMEEFKKKLGCGNDLIRTLINYHNLKPIKAHERKRINDIELNEEHIIKLYENENWSIGNIAKKYNSTPKTIKKILKTNDISILSSGQRQLSDEALLAYNDRAYCNEVKNKSKSFMDFHNKLNCGSDTALKILKKHNIEGFNQSETKLKSYKEKIKKKLTHYDILKLDNTPDVLLKHNKCERKFILQKQSLLRYSSNETKLCPHCNPRKKSSIGEHGIKKFLQFLDIDIQENIRNIIPPYELDIYLPDHNIAIEYCGLYWHSEIYKDKHYHKMKHDLCKEKGIRLITIFEDEWVNNCMLVKNKIRHILNKRKSRIYARNCTIATIDYKIASTFIEENHVQGSDRAGLYYGLYNNHHLVSVMSFKKLNVSRGVKCNDITSNKIELSRYCTSDVVVGGFNKLLNHFIRNHKHEYDTILSYCDLRWGNGDTYKKSGFVYEKTTSVNYWYWKNMQRYHRYNFTKHKLLKQYPDKKHKTEKEIMYENNYNIIWDCGSDLYSLNIK